MAELAEKRAVRDSHTPPAKTLCILHLITIGFWVGPLLGHGARRKFHAKKFKGTEWSRVWHPHGKSVRKNSQPRIPKYSGRESGFRRLFGLSVEIAFSIKLGLCKLPSSAFHIVACSRV